LSIGQLRQEMTIGPVHIESLLEPRMADDTYGERLVDNALALLADRTTTAGTPWALGILACCHALLSEGSDAEPYQAALKAALSASASMPASTCQNADIGDRSRRDCCHPRARSRLNAALISARWVSACGKLPCCSPVRLICSACKPRWLA
jgi:hypothetical protein